MLKPFIIATLALTVASLQVSSHRNSHSMSRHEFTNVNDIHFQQISNNTIQGQIQSHLDLINNQLTLLEQSYQQLRSLNDVEMIGNEGSLIKCKNITSDDEINMKYTLENIDTDLWSVYFQIQHFSKENANTDLLAQQYQQLKQRKQTLESASITYCPQVNNIKPAKVTDQDNSFSDVAQNAFVSNLNASPNWAYGKMSQQQYEIKQFQFLLENDIVQCPKETPFASGGKCVACKDNEVFDLDTVSCSLCPNGTQFNPKSHGCQLQQPTTCINNQQYNLQTSKCQCPSGQPFFNNTHCLSCFIPQYWNSQTTKCQSCPANSYYSIINGGCLKCPSQGNLISSLSGCHDQCTLSKPYYNGVMCISCPQVFNNVTKQCESCSKGLQFSLQKGVCVQKQRVVYLAVKCSKGYVFNKENGQCVKDNLCTCPSNYIYNNKTLKCQCPKELKFDTGVECVSCEAPDIWDQARKLCIEPSTVEPSAIAKVPVDTPQNVPLPTIDLQTTQPTPIAETIQTTPITQITQPIQVTQPTSLAPVASVVPITTVTPVNSITPPTPIKPSTIVTIPNCGANEVYNSKIKNCVCSTNTPYRTLSNQCIKCQSPNKWSEAQRQCLPPAPKCKSNFILDPISQTCTCPKDMPFNDGYKCQSCYLPMYWNNVEKSCQFCPQNQYFNPMTRKCEFCPSARPLLLNHVCQGCQQGTKYNSESHGCENIVCYDGSSYSQDQNDCVCGDGKKPFYNGNECVSCLSPNRWDLASRTCIYDSSFTNNSAVYTSGQQ